jgi:hypothetical protein
MSPTPSPRADRTNATRQQRTRARMIDQGLIRVQVWVPKGQEGLIRLHAERLRLGAAASPAQAPEMSENDEIERHETGGEGDDSRRSWLSWTHPET